MAEAKAGPGIDNEVVQICIVVRDLEATIRAYRKLLGWGPWKVFDFRDVKHGGTVYRGEPFAYSMRIATMSVGGVYLEVIQPVGPGPYQDFIDMKGEGLHHIQVRAPDSGALREHLDANGVPRLMSGSVEIDETDSLGYVLHDATDSLHLYVETVVGNRMKLIGALPSTVMSGD